MALIFHLTHKVAWESARTVGEYSAPSLAEEGFIHCSRDIPQLLRVAGHRLLDLFVRVRVQPRVHRLVVAVEPRARAFAHVRA